MNNLNSSRKPAARTRSGNFLALLLPSVLIPALLMLFLAGGATASAQVVTNTADSGPGTLRSAIANAANGAVITFDPSLSGATIRLASTLTINANLTIDASALPGDLEINGNNAVTVFNVGSTITVFLNSLTITGGYTATSSATMFVGGGGIDNYGTLTLTNCTLSGNSATNGGGGGGGGGDGGSIYNLGALTLNQCTLSGNSANSGGGIWNGWLLTMNQCTLSGNSGGGIYNQVGTMTLNQCTLSGNSGGGIYNREGIITLNQCSLSGNSGYIGGGIFNFAYGTLALNQCTLSGNNATDEGAGIFIDERATILAMTNTIVAGNYDLLYGEDDIDSFYYPVITYGGSNLVPSGIYGGGTITGPAPLTNAPDLAPLGNYGGPTQTMPPLPGSPAIDAGSVAANTFATDQRGYPRTQNGLIDLGAVELQSPAANPSVLENIIVPAGGGNGLQFTFTNAPAADFTVLTATNVSLALTNWIVLGEVRQVAPGQYQFTDHSASNSPQRFYDVVSP